MALPLSFIAKALADDYIALVDVSSNDTEKDVLHLANLKELELIVKDEPTLENIAIWAANNSLLLTRLAPAPTGRDYTVEERFAINMDSLSRIVERAGAK